MKEQGEEGREDKNGIQDGRQVGNEDCQGGGLEGGPKGMEDDTASAASAELLSCLVCEEGLRWGLISASTPIL